MAERRRGPLVGSVRARVTALAAVLVLVVLVVAGAALVVTLRQLQLGDIDDNLRLRADDIEVLAESGAISTLPFSADTVTQIVEGGRVVAASHPAIETSSIAVAPDGDETLSTSEAIEVDDDVYRVLSRRIEGGLVLHVARAIDDVDDTSQVLVGVLAVVVPLVTLVLAAAVWMLTGRTLRPVEAIRAEVAAMTGDELERRVPVPPGHDEIARLAETMNDMLQRVEEAQLRQLHFTADASHELRSPLTRIRSELEVDLAHPRGADPEATHRSVLEEVEVLQRTIDDLLLLARGESAVSPPSTPVDLDDIVLREVAVRRDASAVELDVSGVSGAQVTGDELQLSRAVRNLLDNAVRHARGRVVVTLEETDGEAVLTVADDGPGIPAADRERVFERFTRLDEARTRHTGGSGLGLPISRGIAERHGGSLTVDPTHDGGARLVLRLAAAV